MATDEPFVFINMGEVNPNGKFDGEEQSLYQNAIHIQNMGHDELAAKNFAKAIEVYGDAVVILQSLDVAKCCRELAICYQGQAEAYEHSNELGLVIETATKAIEVDATYAKAYFRRACGYMAQKKSYLALEDIVWACVLNRFGNDTYNKMAADINAQHGKLNTVFMRIQVLKMRRIESDFIAK